VQLVHLLGRGPAVRVVADLLDGERVVARGVAFAGGEPTPEQVYELHGAKSWDELGQALAARWAGPIRPGASLPFFVVLQAPHHAEDLRIRVTAAPAELPSPAPGTQPIAAD